MPFEYCVLAFLSLVVVGCLLSHPLWFHPVLVLPFHDRLGRVGATWTCRFFLRFHPVSVSVCVVCRVCSDYICPLLQPVWFAPSAKCSTSSSLARFATATSLLGIYIYQLSGCFLYLL